MNTGLQSIFDLCYVLNPVTALDAFVKGKLNLMTIPDSCFIVVLFGLLAMVMAPLISTFLNIMNQTDEVLKLKAGKCKIGDAAKIEF